MKKALISLVTAAAIVVSSLPAVAAGSVVPKAPAAKVQATQTQTASAGPLTPGGAAGVKQAQGFEDIPLIWLVGAAGVVVLGILAFSGDDDDDAAPSTGT